MIDSCANIVLNTHRQGVVCWLKGIVVVKVNRRCFFLSLLCRSTLGTTDTFEAPADEQDAGHVTLQQMQGALQNALNALEDTKRVYISFC